MPRTIRFLVDEHVAHAVVDGLQRRGIDVTTPADAGLLGAPDTEHIAYGIAQRRVIFSEDEDFLALAAGGAAHSGLVYCKQNTRTIGQIIRALVFIWEVYDPDEIENRIEFI